MRVMFRRRASGEKALGSDQAIAKLGVGCMRSVTERFVLGLAAAAQCHAIANFLGLAIRADERDTSTNPQRTATLLRRILN